MVKAELSRPRGAKGYGREEARIDVNMFWNQRLLGA